MKKISNTNRNIPQCHDHKLLKRTQRSEKKRQIKLLELRSKPISDKKKKLKDHNEKVSAYNKRLIDEIGIDPKYMHSAKRKRIEQINNIIKQTYAESLVNFKKKMQQEDVEQYRRAHPEAKNIIQRKF
jgi:hypothetical protein